MELVRITAENIDREHICCAISEKKGENCVSAKKAWLKERLKEGLEFIKLDVRGKVFIEYIPAEYAWCPVEAPGYLFINCFWVAGQFKGQGYGNQLLDYCIADAKKKGRKGLVALSSRKKMPYLSDPGFFRHRGFQTADTAEPHYELLYLPFEEDNRQAPESLPSQADGNKSIPYLKECAKYGVTEEKGWVLYYTHQCPHTAKYVPVLTGYAKNRGITIRTVRFENAEEARNSPNPFTTYALFYDGKFVTNEIQSENSFEKRLTKMGL